MSPSRRDFIAAAALLWQAAVVRAQQAPAPEAAFLQPEERKTLRVLMARIIPADERSGGAVGAATDAYIDFILLHADSELQSTWREGLAGYGHAIEGKDDDGVDAFLAVQAQNEFAPSTSGEKFFVLLKAAVAEGFYTSEIGIKQELGYQGMAFLLDFPGCTHPHHEIPAGYRPLLRQRES